MVDHISAIIDARYMEPALTVCRGGTFTPRTCNDSLFLHGNLAQFVEVAEQKSRNFKIKVGIVRPGPSGSLK